MKVDGCQLTGLIDVKRELIDRRGISIPPVNSTINPRTNFGPSKLMVINVRGNSFIGKGYATSEQADQLKDRAGWIWRPWRNHRLGPR